MEAALKTSIIIPKYRETAKRYTNYGKMFLVLFLTVLVLYQICSARPCILLCTSINKKKTFKRITVFQIWTNIQPWVTLNFSHNPYTPWTQHNQTLCKMPWSLSSMLKVLHNQNKYLDLEAAYFQWTWLKFFVGRTLFQSKLDDVFQGNLWKKSQHY